MKFYELSPSPNNVKVYLALKVKGIDFEIVPVDPFDRSALREVSGQELTPVIEDRGIVLNDSEAILNYLDANYPDTPRLFPADRDGRRACEQWKSWLDGHIAKSWRPLFFYAIKVEETLDAQAQEHFAALLAELDGKLASSDTFGDGAHAINDLRVAEWAVYGLPGEGLIARVPLFRKIREVFAVDPAEYPRLTRFLEPWHERLA